VTSQTLKVEVSGLPPTLTLQARLYPEYEFGSEVITLTHDAQTYSGTFQLDYPPLAGHVQVWVEESYTETNPRREAMVGYAIGGNPGGYGENGPLSRVRGPLSRVRGTLSRPGGTLSLGYSSSSRVRGPLSRARGAPLASPDWQMIFFVANPRVFDEGELFAIHSMAALPPVPAGRKAVSGGYNLVASPNVTQPLTGSVSFQYLSIDVLIEGADEDQLKIYFWDRGQGQWRALDTIRDTYYNLLSAPSQGQGIYAVMYSVEIPLYGPGWNLISYPILESQPVAEALLSISGYYTTVYGFEASDQDDPWRVYDVTVPDFVNDLDVLDHAHGFWIKVREPITLYLAGGESPMLAPEAILPGPPATYYGEVLAGADFAPTAGTQVTAWVEGQLCGQAHTVEIDGHVMYAIDVFAYDSGSAAGCGAPGRRVTFWVGGQFMAPRAIWSDERLWELPLTPGLRQHLYLPLVVKQQ
jgi:hypothetical protein